MRNRKIFLLSIVISAALVIEGWAFFSKPKLRINKSNLFEAEVAKVVAAKLMEESASVKETADTTKTIQEEEQGLALELLGTAISNPKDPIAFIKDLQTEKQGMYKQGSRVQGATLVKIVMGEVTLERNGKRETLLLSKRARAWSGVNADNVAPILINGNDITVSKKGLLNEAQNVLSTLPKVKVKPYYEAKQVAGLMVDGIPEDSVIATAGIRNKDVVKTVNNQRVNSYQQALQIFQKVKNQAEIKITLLREGKIQNLNYFIKN